jgi:CheY-like chemotaxis protein
MMEQSESMVKRRIIIADDDEDDRMLLQSAFQENRVDVEIEFALDGSDLMKMLADQKSVLPISFVLLDLNMPRKDGREALREIKQHPILKKIPVIVFTTAKNESEIRKCYDLGANTYIVKPDGFESLRKVVLNLTTYWFDTATVC